MDDIDDYYVGAEYPSELDNGQTLTNIRDFDEPAVEKNVLRVIKFITNSNQITEGTNLHSVEFLKRKENTVNKLLNSRDRLDSLIMFLSSLTLEKPFYKLKSVNIDTEDKSLKNELSKVNYLKKVNSFSQSIANFKRSLDELNEKNRLTQIIFKELLFLKELGFCIEDSFNLSEVRSNVSINLTHKLAKLYQNLNRSSESTKKFLSKLKFVLNYNKEKNKFDLSSKFYEEFNKKFRLNFSLKFKTRESTILLEGLNFERILEEKIAESVKGYSLKDNGKYKIEKFLVFYVKYFLFFIFKFEIRSLNLICDGNMFEYKNFTFTTNETTQDFSLTLNSFNFFDLELRISKNQNKIDDFNENIEMFDNTNILKVSNISGSFKQNKLDYNSLVGFLLKNIVYDMKLYKVINELSSLNQKFDSALVTQLEASIFISNLVKISYVITRKSFINILTHQIEGLKNVYSNRQCFINPVQKEFVYKFILYNIPIYNQSFSPRLEFSVGFNKGNFTLEIKNQNKNNIYILERGTSLESYYKTVDLDFVLAYLSNLIDRIN